MQEKYLKISDLYAAVWLALHGLQPTFETHGTRTLFVFPANDQTYRLLNDFNSGASCSAIDFSTRLRELRALMYGARAGAK